MFWTNPEIRKITFVKSAVRGCQTSGIDSLNRSESDLDKENIPTTIINYGRRIVSPLVFL